MLSQHNKRPGRSNMEDISSNSRKAVRQKQNSMSAQSKRKNMEDISSSSKKKRKKWSGKKKKIFRHDDRAIKTKLCLYFKLIFKNIGTKK